MGFETSSELFINIKNPPVYDRTKSYFDQSLDVLQFYEEEWKKITQGVTIGGYSIHPWLYFHMNLFKTPIPQPNRTKKIMCPPLDDNTLYIAESYQEAEISNMGLLLFGTRGFTKSTFLASVSHWTSLIKDSGTMMIVGGNDGDLASIASFIEKSMMNINPAFQLPTITKDWKSSVVFGYKEDRSNNIEHSRIIIRNVEDGAEKKSEKTAGANPSGYISDEIGKHSFLSSFESAIPSFSTPYGYNLVPILTGTSGNNNLSKDAKKMLENPLAYKMLPMNWDRLDRSVPEEWQTWKQGRKLPFGTFVPGQMSYRAEVLKIESNLADHLKVKNKDLKQIPINVTDWEKATCYLQDQNAQKKGEESKNKDKMYYPMDTPDCFLTETANPFPTSVIERRIRELENLGKIGKSIEIFREGSKFRYEFSNKERAGLHYEGKVCDAPIVLYGEFPEKTPSDYLHAGGLDDYKLDAAKTTQSWGSGYVLLRRNMMLNQPCEKIIMSYTGRTNVHEDFYGNLEKMYEVCNSLTLIEGVDVNFLPYLRARKKDAKILAKAITFADKSGKGKLSAQYGLYPSTGNNEYRFSLMVGFTWEEFTVGVEEDGTPIVKYGVDFIDDIDLLREWLEYTKGGNFDRMDAFSHALVQAKEMDKANLRPKENIDYEDYKAPVDYQKMVSKPYTFDKRIRGKYR